MKSKLVLLMLIICCLALTVGLLVACNPNSGEQNGQPEEGDGGKDETLYFTVAFDTQGGSHIADITVEDGQIIGELTLPTKQCSRLVGFALDADGERMWDVLTDKVSADITLYAIWEDAHDWGEWTVTTPATCTEDGERTRTCNACGETEKEVVSAAHTWGEWETITAPTCTSDGTQKRVCEVCGKEETGNIPALGHDFEEEYTVDVEPGCETTGSESRHCTRCEATTDSREIAALGHDYEGAEWHYNDANHWRYCTRCGKESERELHSYDSDGVCECGMIEVAPVNEFRFISLGNNTWRLANYTGSRTNVSIPSTYNNGTVVSISDDAFSGNTAMQTLVISDTVTSIGARAFSGCVNLTSITISKNLTTIGEDAFEGCTQIADATIPAMAAASIDKGALTILHVTAGAIEESAFENCANLTTLTIGEDVENVGDRSFSGCSKLVYVTIEDGVKTIGKGAFVNCTGISEISVPDSVTDIGDSAFSGCSGLVEMTLPFVGGSADTTSPSASTLFGYIFGSSSFSGAFETVQLYGTEEGASATFYIPRYLTSVTVGGEILFGAFYGCDRIETITLTSATALGDYAFYNNISLTEIIIPASVESIGEMTFAYCTALEDIDFPQSIKMVGVNAMMESAWYDAQLEGIVYIGKTLYDYKGTMPSNMVISVPDGIYSISEEAFAGCSGLHSITMTDSVTSIGERAFYNCYGLISIIIGDGVQSIGEEAFAGCSSLKKVTMPAVAINYIPQDNLQTVSITSGAIGERAFYNCNGLISVTIGNSVTSIGSSAFYGCTKLTEINWDAVSVNDFMSGSNVFYNAGTAGNGITVTFGDSVRKIPAYAFYVSSSSYHPNIKRVTIGNSVTSIGSYAFYDCTGLTSITIPDSVTSIGSSAFSGCTGLTEINWNAVSVNNFTSSSDVFNNAGKLGDGIMVTFGGSVRNIPAYAFYVSSSSYRPNIKSVTIGDGVTSIGSSAFYGCSGLTSITIPDSVTSIGSSAFYGCSGLTSIYYTGDMTGWCGISGLSAIMSSGRALYIDGSKVEGEVVIPDGVQSVPSYAFYYQTGITSITFPDSVTSIGDRAFYGCSELTSVTVPDGVTSIGLNAFGNCTGLIEINWNAASVSDFSSENDAFHNAGTAGGGITVTFGDSVRKIPAYAFYVSSSSYLPNIKSVTIGNSVTSIGSFAFSGCGGLTSIIITDSVTSIGERAFENCSGLTSAYYTGDVVGWCGISFGDSYANPLRYAGNLYIDGSLVIDLVIPDSVTRIGNYAFYGCSGLTSVTIPDSVTRIGNYAFYGCSGLTSVTIPDSVTSIGSSAFSGCTGLTEIIWNATSVEDFSYNSNVFYNAGKLGDGIAVTFSDSVETIPAYAFYVSSSSYRPNIKSVTIGNSVTILGDSAFNGCAGLTSITIPDSVTSIGSAAVSACTGLTSITIGNSVTSIGSYAFTGCTGLMSITIPDSVTSIGSSAFYGCNGLTSVIYEGTTAQWNAISKTDWDRSSSVETVKCSNGTVKV